MFSKLSVHYFQVPPQIVNISIDFSPCQLHVVCYCMHGRIFDWDAILLTGNINVNRLKIFLIEE